MPVPKKIGRFAVLQRLATGGMAEVFICCERGMAGLERLVVVKRILPHLSSQSPFVAMFLSEARYVARLNHPNVVQIYELGEESDPMLGVGPFLAMEYVPGSSLREVIVASIESGTVPPVGAAIGLIAQACAGAHAAHELTDSDGKALGLVHRDISPHNLMVTSEGHLKLLDFGIAKATEAAHADDHTRTGALKGKVHYMAPEQCKQEPLDRRADVFALGIVLWEMLAQERLFKRESDLRSMQAIVNGERRDLAELRPDIPRTIIDAIDVSLRRDRQERYATADDMRRALVEACTRTGMRCDLDTVAAFVKPLVGAANGKRSAEFIALAQDRTRAAATPRAGDTPATTVGKYVQRPGEEEPPWVTPAYAYSPRQRERAAEENEPRQPAPPGTPQQRGAAFGPTFGTASNAAFDLAFDAAIDAAIAPPVASTTAPAMDSTIHPGTAPAIGPVADAAPSAAHAPASRKKRVAALLVSITAVVLLGFASRQLGGKSAGPLLRIGFPGTAAANLVLEDLRPLDAHLERTLGRPVEFVVEGSYDQLLADFLDGRLEVAVLPPHTYVTARERLPDIELLAQKVIDGSSGSDGVLVVHENSTATSVADLRGARVCFADPLSTTGFVLARKALRAAGLDPDKDIVARISGNHLQVLRDVVDGACDAGATYSGGYLAADRAGIPVARVRQLALTGRTPQDAICARGTLPVEERARIRAALLAYHPTTNGPPTARVERISGFVAVSDDDYRVVRDASTPHH